MNPRLFILNEPTAPRLNPALACEIGLNETIFLTLVNIPQPFKTIDACRYLPFFSKSTVHRTLISLIDKGYIEQIAFTSGEIKTLLSDRHYNLNDFGACVCEWCQSRVLVIQDHHYPVPRGAGGVDTVKICPNCHAGYHYLKDSETFKILGGAI